MTYLLKELAGKSEIPDVGRRLRAWRYSHKPSDLDLPAELPSGRSRMARVTQSELAAMIGISARAIRALEVGGHGNRKTHVGKDSIERVEDFLRLWDGK
jgi:hypothetical protein